MRFLIIAFLEERMVFSIQKVSNSISSIRIEEVEFTCDKISQADGFIGFFDWLRPDSQSICGVRMSFIDKDKYMNIFTGYKYLDTDLNLGSVTVYFNGRTPFSSVLSDDQAFTHNYLFYSKAYDIALTFKLEDLEYDEIIMLEKSINLN